MRPALASRFSRARLATFPGRLFADRTERRRSPSRSGTAQLAPVQVAPLYPPRAVASCPARLLLTSSSPTAYQHALHRDRRLLGRREPGIHAFAGRAVAPRRAPRHRGLWGGRASARRRCGRRAGRRRRRDRGPAPGPAVHRRRSVGVGRLALLGLRPEARRRDPRGVRVLRQVGHHSLRHGRGVRARSVRRAAPQVRRRLCRPGGQGDGGQGRHHRHQVCAAAVAAGPQGRGRSGEEERSAARKGLDRPLPDSL